VSYNGKHNEPNNENNRDGADDNASWNCGAEGPTNDPEINALRHRQKKNFLATLLLSQGVPMICGGDEISHTQQGNNNAYCQDNDITWLNWDLDEEKQDLLEFTKLMIQIRKKHPVLRRRTYFKGGAGVKGILWLRPDGKEMTEEDWKASHVRTIGMLLDGSAIDEPDERGRKIEDDSFILLLNAYHEDIKYCLPGGSWDLLVATAAKNGSKTQKGGKARAQKVSEEFVVGGRSVALLSRRNAELIT
jgi:glycogen operon protein